MRSEYKPMYTEPDDVGEGRRDIEHGYVYLHYSDVKTLCVPVMSARSSTNHKWLAIFYIPADQEQILSLIVSDKFRASDAYRNDIEISGCIPVGMPGNNREDALDNIRRALERDLAPLGQPN